MRIGPTELTVVSGSLLDQDVDAIVNAANTSMRGGGGIDGAIHRAAGPALRAELERVAPAGAPTGTVVVTAGHRLRQRWILHTPGPVWSGGRRGEPGLLRACYGGCLDAAAALGVARLGFCSISTGVYRFPLGPAAEIALGTVCDWLRARPATSLRAVVFAMFGTEEHRVFAETLRRLETESA
jgi:O-acetyl-ADP-ribose deacetylase (regulator of RNase III)